MSRYTSCADEFAKIAGAGKEALKLLAAKGKKIKEVASAGKSWLTSAGKQVRDATKNPSGAQKRIATLTANSENAKQLLKNPAFSGQAKAMIASNAAQVRLAKVGLGLRKHRGKLLLGGGVAAGVAAG